MWRSTHFRQFLCCTQISENFRTPGWERDHRTLKEKNTRWVRHVHVGLASYCPRVSLIMDSYGYEWHCKVRIQMWCNMWQVIGVLKWRSGPWNRAAQVSFVDLFIHVKISEKQAYFFGYIHSDPVLNLPKHWGMLIHYTICLLPMRTKNQCWQREKAANILPALPVSCAT